MPLAVNVETGDNWGEMVPCGFEELKNICRTRQKEYYKYNHMKNKKTIFLIGVAILSDNFNLQPQVSQGRQYGVSVAGGQGAIDTSDKDGSGESDEIVKILSMLSKVDLKTDFFKDQLFKSGRFVCSAG